MGRQAYLTHLAWGRSAWSRPESNTWFVRNGQINWDEFIQQRRNAPLEGQYPGHVQEYNASLHPINPESRYYGKAMARSANTILSLLGVVVPDASGPGGETNRPEDDLILPMGLATEIFKDLTTTWVVNLTERLLAFPPDPRMPFFNIIASQYRSMGSNAFFFAGLPSAFLSFPTLPTILENQLSYLSYRLVVALVASSKTRQRCFDIAPFARQIIDFSLTLLQWPFRLHATLQKLGLVSASKFFPEPRSYIPFLGTSPIQFLNTPLPILIFLLYQPARMAMSRNLLPLLSFQPRLPIEATDGHKARKAKKHDSVNDVSGISSLLHKISSFFYNHSPFPISITPQTRSQSSSLAENAASRPRLASGVENATGEDINNATIHGPSRVAEEGQETSLGHDAISRHVIDATHPDGSEQNSQRGISQSDEDERDRMSEDMEHNTGSEARIRISSMDMASGTINLQVEIGVAEETHDQVLDPSGHAQEPGPGPREMAATIPHKAIPFSELAFLPSFIAHRWIFRNVASLILLPASTFVLRGLATHYLNNGGFGVSPYLVGTSIGTTIFGAGPLISWSNAQSIGSYVSKVGICFLVRYTVETGILAINSITVSWVGRTYFGWTLL